MKVGFTGTQKGMTQKQLENLETVIKRLYYSPYPHEFHHGDCIGADAQAAKMFYEEGWQLCCHPPDNPSKRAFMPNKLYHHLVSPPQPYLERNKNIVDACDILIAAPATEQEIRRSGTWATIRYARSKRKPMIRIDP